MPDAGSTTKPPVGGSATGSGCSDKIEMENMIADFEDGTNGILPVGGRGAGFYVYDDGSGKQMAAPSGPMGGACASMYSYRSVGAGYSKWGAGIGTDLVAGAMKQSFNASAYSGIRFMARAGSAVMVRFKAQDKNTIPEGGVCKPGGCNNNFGKIVSVGTDWKSYTVLFKDMTQEDWGDIFPAFEKDKIYGLQFQFAKGVDFDLSIDNVAFVK